MSDDTRISGDAAPEVGAGRTSADDWPGQVWPANLGDQIDSLFETGEQVLALALPWAESVRKVLFHFEAVLAPLNLNDDLHRQVGEAAGITGLYDQLDSLGTATSDFG